MNKKNKIIMWMDESTGKYYACEVIKGFRLAFGNNIEDCMNNIEPEVYSKVIEAKNVANSVVRNTGLSAIVLNVVKYKSVLENQVKDKNVKIVHMIMGRKEKQSVRENLIKS